MTYEEHRLLFALAWMCEQYLGDEHGSLDHMCMSPGENATKLLDRYGLLDGIGRGGTWNEAGRAFLKNAP